MKTFKEFNEMLANDEEIYLETVDSFDGVDKSFYLDKLIDGVSFGISIDESLFYVCADENLAKEKFNELKTGLEGRK